MWFRYTLVTFLSLSLLTLGACSSKKKTTVPAAPTYTIGVTVSGLSGVGLVLQNNAGDNLPVNASGSVSFATALNEGASYSVSILTQPSTPTQTCSVTNGSGTVAKTNITTVTVNCVTNTYSVGGNVSGLSGSGLVLQNNGGGNLAISADGSYTIAASALSGTTYSVSVLTQPSSPTQTCTVSNASGTLGGANVTNINVACTTNTYTIGGSVTGLAGGGLTLQNNGGGDLVINTNGSFTFATPVASGATYTVSTSTQPSSPAQTCAVTNGSGTVVSANITNVTVTCSLWTKQLGSAAMDVGRAVAADASGNIIVAGYTSGGFDSNSSNGNDDAIIVKYAANANKSWSVQFGSNSEDQANGVAVDTSGNIYVVGYSNGILVSGSDAGLYDIFVTKYDAAGTRQWIRQFGTTENERANAVVVDTSGNVYITGRTAGGLDGGTNASVGVGVGDAFLIKYDTSGARQWTKLLGTSAEDEAYSVAVDAGGNIFIAGLTNGDLVGTNAGNSDMFVAKYDSTGTLVWTQQLGNGSNDVARGVATDSSGNVYVTGYTGGSLDSQVWIGATDAFITKYNAAGAKQWTKQFGSSDSSKDDAAFAITIDATDSIYVTGYINSALTVGDVFVAKYDTLGTQQWISQFGTTGADTGLGVVTDSNGYVFVTGSTDGGLDGYNNLGPNDVFLVKYNASGVKQ